MIEAGVCSEKELRWLACREKRCCSAYLVPLTGMDIWRISQTMELPPFAFTLYTDSSPDTLGFALDTSDRRYEVVLARHRDREDQDTSCAFLWRLPDGHAQCGLGRLRPGVCKTYPYGTVGGILYVGDCSGCSCKNWAANEIDSVEIVEQLRRHKSELAEYQEILRSWNDRVRRVGSECSYFEFCDYLVSAYSELHGRLQQTIGRPYELS